MIWNAEVCKIMFQTRGCKTFSYRKENHLLTFPFDKRTEICVMKSDRYKAKVNEILNLEQFKIVSATQKNAKDMCLKKEKRVNDILNGHAFHDWKVIPLFLTKKRSSEKVLNFIKTLK